MKRVFIVICISIASLFAMSAIAAQVGVVDMQKIFRSAPQVKQINATLTKQFANRKTSIMKMGKQLQTDIQQYQKNKAVMSAKELKNLKSKITKEETQLRQAQSKFQQDLFAAQNKKMTQFMDNVRRIVKSIAAKKKLDMVLPQNTVLYSDTGLNITDEVLSKLS